MFETLEAMYNANPFETIKFLWLWSLKFIMIGSAIYCMYKDEENGGFKFLVLIALAHLLGTGVIPK